MSTQDGGPPNRPDWLSGAYEIVQTVATKSVVTSIQWITGITAMFSAAVIIWGPSFLAGWAFALFAFCLFGFFAAYFIWMRMAPERLQSEKHISDMTRMNIELAGDDRHKSDPKIINAEPVANSHPATPLEITAPSEQLGQATEGTGADR